MTDHVAVVVLDQNGLDYAHRIRTGIKNVPAHVSIHGLSGRTTGDVDVSFDRTAEHLRALFEQGTSIVAVCAAGILIRSLAERLSDKFAEPPVIAVSNDGSAVVPLLGGHHGANRLARKIADILNVAPAITTAGDVRLGIAPDEPPAGWHVHNPSAAKKIVAALLAGERVSLRVEAGDSAWLDDAGDRFSDTGKMSVLISDRVVDESGPVLVLNPPSLALGVGCERNAEPSELIGLVEKTLSTAHLTPKSVACVASVDLKADEQAVHDLAAHLGVQARFFTPEELELQADRLRNPSDIVYRETGCHGVSEGAALAAVGAEGWLIVEKQKSRRATCAVARAAGDIMASQVGRPRGSLSIVGIGPGLDEWRTPQVTHALSAADDVVGYGLYLDLVSHVIVGKVRHEFDLAQEEARVRRALDLAGEGKRVALVCSGDAGIYALAALVFELLDREDRADWNRVDISVCPGISAIQAAASRIGAPIGHDFCTVSLSDLLTPWPVIQKRLEGAAIGDFVVALYNPASKKRQKHIADARDILLRHRPAETPVVLAHNLGRDGESISVVRLDELGPDKADMLTLVLIGNSQSRFIQRGSGRWVYTPRGYAKKMSPVIGAAAGDAA